MATLLARSLKNAFSIAISPSVCRPACSSEQNFLALWRSLSTKSASGALPRAARNSDIDESFGRAEFEESFRELEEPSPNQDLIEQYLSDANLSRSQIVKRELEQARQPFKKHEYDGGSCEVQVAALTRRIALMTEHLTQHEQDKSSRRGLMGMLARRRKLMKYLRRRNPDSYQMILTRLSLKDRFGPGSKYPNKR